jgi:F-type H+-transporting ATPase subunit delta
MTAIIARPYAKAVFEYALQQQALPLWSEMLKSAATVVRDPRVKNLLSDPRLGPADLACLVVDVCAKVLNPAANNLIELLAVNRRLSVLPDIATLFETYRAEHEKTVDVQITSAMPLSAKAKNNLLHALKERLRREIFLHCHVDPAVLGGAVIRAGDWVIDGSLRGKLSRLANALR